MRLIADHWDDSCTRVDHGGSLLLDRYGYRHSHYDHYDLPPQRWSSIGSDGSAKTLRSALYPWGGYTQLVRLVNMIINGVSLLICVFVCAQERCWYRLIERADEQYTSGYSRALRHPECPWYATCKGLMPSLNTVGREKVPKVMIEKGVQHPRG